MTFTTADIVIRLLLAIVVGGIIGAEREFRTGTGLRTLMQDERVRELYVA